jgi:hypothetical protein
MNRMLISIVLTGVLGLYGGSANAASFVAGTGTQAGTVTDNTTNLMWQQCSDGLSGADCATGTAATVTWDTAIAGCEGLLLGGYSDWRLPTVKELKSIADMTKSSPAIDAVYFPNTVNFNYWSSTSYAADANNYALCVNFNDGHQASYYKMNPLTFRCVRGQ